MDGAELPGPSGATRTVSLRWMRASSRVYLQPSLLAQLFGAASQPHIIMESVAGDLLALERVGVSGAGSKELKVRLAVAPHGQHPATTRVALTSAALTALDLHAGAFGAESTTGVALSGSKGAVVLTAGVVRAAPRLLLPEGVAARLQVAAGQKVDLSLPTLGETVDRALSVEVRTDVREALMLVDGPLADRLGEPGGNVLAGVAAVPDRHR